MLGFDAHSERPVVGLSGWRLSSMSRLGGLEKLGEVYLFTKVLKLFK
jgi:hypothetical protein